MEKVPVWVTVHSKQRLKSGEKHAFKAEAQGMMYKKGEVVYISYREEADAGLGATATTIRVEGKRVTLIRQGETVMRQVLVKGEEQSGTYVTPHGTFELTTRTSQLVIALSDGGGHLEATYNIKLSGEKSRMELRVDVRVQTA